jgi:hypothetical protein
MLNWLSKLFRRRQEASPQRPSTSRVRVIHDDKFITVYDGEGGVVMLDWADISNVTVMTTDAGPFEIDLFWILSDRDRRRSVVVPMGARGEHDLLQAMQVRLSGFDNMAVVEAMSSTGNAEFQIWPAAEMA